MSIDNCTYTFEELSEKVLPDLFSRLADYIEIPMAAAEFVGYKSATKEALEKVNLTVGFPGCYVFIDNKKPVYVGISRSLVKRLAQHLNHDSHYSASLVYKMATEEYPREMKRDQAMKDDQFREAFLAKQEQLQKMAVAFIEIQNDLELYLFEVYVSMKLDTDTWNAFRTH